MLSARTSHSKHLEPWLPIPAVLYADYVPPPPPLTPFDPLNIVERLTVSNVHTLMRVEEGIDANVVHLVIKAMVRLDFIVPTSASFSIYLSMYPPLPLLRSDSLYLIGGGSVTNFGTILVPPRIVTNQPSSVSAFIHENKITLTTETSGAADVMSTEGVLHCECWYPTSSC